MKIKDPQHRPCFGTCFVLVHVTDTHPQQVRLTGGAAARQRHAAGGAAAASVWPLRRSHWRGSPAKARSHWRGTPGKAEAAEEAAEAGGSNEIQPCERAAGSRDEKTMGETHKVRGKRQDAILAAARPQRRRLQGMREALCA